VNTPHRRLFAEIKMNWMDQVSASQKTDVVSLNAEVLDVSEEAGPLHCQRALHRPAA
jgi:hypothetical protein